MDAAPELEYLPSGSSGFVAGGRASARGAVFAWVAYIAVVFVTSVSRTGIDDNLILGILVIVAILVILVIGLGILGAVFGMIVGLVRLPRVGALLLAPSVGAVIGYSAMSGDLEPNTAGRIVMTIAGVVCGLITAHRFIELEPKLRTKLK